MGRGKGGLGFDVITLIREDFVGHGMKVLVTQRLRGYGSSREFDFFLLSMRFPIVRTILTKSKAHIDVPAHGQTNK